MLTIPEMVMIGGNSRNSGKTTIACSIIRKLATNHEVIGLKVTSVRPGEENLHGSHDEGIPANFSIFEEKITESHKDTSKMLKAGATHVYYIQVADTNIEEAISYFLTRHIKKQLIVCESRSLREIVTPGLFLMMMKLPAPGIAKDVSFFLPKADKVFYFDEDKTESDQFAANLYFQNGIFGSK